MMPSAPVCARTASGLFNAVDVAVGNHRYINRCLHFGNSLIIHRAFESLFSGTAVEYKHFDSGFLGKRRNI